MHNSNLINNFLPQFDTIHPRQCLLSDWVQQVTKMVAKLIEALVWDA